MRQFWRRCCLPAVCCTGGEVDFVTLFSVVTAVASQALPALPGASPAREGHHADLEPPWADLGSDGSDNAKKRYKIYLTPRATDRRQAATTPKLAAR